MAKLGHPHRGAATGPLPSLAIRGGVTGLLLAPHWPLATHHRPHWGGEPLPTGHTPPGATLAKKGSHSFGPTGEAGLRLLATYATASPTGQRSGRPPVGQKGTTPLTGHLLAKRDGEGKKQASPTPHRLTDWRPMPNPLPLSLPMFPILPMWPHNTQKTGEVITASYITTCAAPSRLTHVFGGIFSAFFLFSATYTPLSLFSFFTT